MSVSFGDSIRRGRQAAGLTQAKVAQLIGKSPSTVRAWELGRTQPSDPGSVTALAAVLGFDETDLMDRAGFEPPPPEETEPALEQQLASLKTIEAERQNHPTPVIAADNSAVSVDSDPWMEDVAARGATLAQPTIVQPTIDEPTWFQSQGKALLDKADGWKRELQRRLAERPPRPPKPVATRPPPRPQKVVTPVPIPEESRVASFVARSYVEVEGERDFYRRRMVATLLVLAGLAITLGWALRNTSGAIGEFVGGFIDMLNIT